MTNADEFTCVICNRSFKSAKGLSKHVTQKYNITARDYYLTYVDPDVPTLCPECLKKGIETELTFNGLGKGFVKLCRQCNFKNSDRIKKCQDSIKKKYGGMGLASNAIKAKAKSTMIKKHGVDNPSQIKESVAKRTETRKKHADVISKNISKGLLNSDKPIGAASDGYKEKALERSNGSCTNFGQIPEVKEKIKETFEEKFEGGHPMRDAEVKDKHKQTVKDRYGVNNISKVPEVIKRIKEKKLEEYGYECELGNEEWREENKKRLLEKYGEDSYSKTDEFKHNLEAKVNSNQREQAKARIASYFEENKLELMSEYTHVKDPLSIKCLKCGHVFETYWGYVSNNVYPCPNCGKRPGISKQEQEVFEFCQSIFLDTEIIQSDQSILPGRYEIDIYIPEYKLAIEFNGAYYHDATHKDEHYHLEKSQIAEQKGITLFHIFEHEWICQQDVVKSLILKHIKQLPRCTQYKIIDLDLDQSEQFIRNHHIYYDQLGEHNIGLLSHDNEIITVASYSQNESASFIRVYASHTDLYPEHGLFTIINHIQSASNKPVYIQFDRRLPNDECITELKHFKNTVPSYIWYNDRSKMVYDKNYYTNESVRQLHENNAIAHFDCDLTIESILVKNNIYKLYDSGRMIYKYG